MRHILSTALVAVIVSALTVTVTGALAQEPAPAPAEEPAIELTGLNADTVDGRHAVKATWKKQQRKNKLVATNRQGLLPSNIVKPKWELLRNVPAGFADGVDDVGGLGYVSWIVPLTFSVGSSATSVMVQDGAGIDTELQILPLSVNDEVIVTEETYKRVAGGDIQHWYRVDRHPSSPSATVQFKIRVRAFNQGIASATVTTAAFKRVAKDAVRVKVVKRR